MAKDPKLYIEHILTEIEFLERIAEKFNYQDFQADPIVYRGAVYSVQCISEAAKNLPTEWLDEYPHIRWRDIRGIGNHTRHEYSHLRPFMIWDIIIDHLPALKKAVMKLRAK
jgi:uncharacterized protein with HEPN domain